MADTRRHGSRMENCGGGAGPNAFGQQGTPDGDRLHSVDSALEVWAEQGFAPNRLITAKHEGNNPAQPVVRTRPLRPWPQVARYKGSGGTDDEAGFACLRS
jgi:feruloyl esterase